MTTDDVILHIFYLVATSPSSDSPFLVNTSILGKSIDNARYDPATGRQISQSYIKTTDIFPNAGTPTTNRIFMPGLDYQGNMGRNNIFAHGANNFDMQFSKQFRISEGRKLVVRIDFFNIFNRVQWALPNWSALNAESTFMSITTQRNGPRTGRFVLRYVF